MAQDDGEYEEGLLWTGLRLARTGLYGFSDALFGADPPTEEELRKERARAEIRKARKAERDVTMCETRLRQLKAKLNREVALSVKQPDVYTQSHLLATAREIHQAQRELEIERAHRMDAVQISRDRKDVERLHQRLDEHEDLTEEYREAAQGLSPYAAQLATHEMLRAQELARQVDSSLREGRRDLRSARREQWREEAAEDRQAQEEEDEEEEEEVSADVGGGKGGGSSGGLRVVDPVREILARAMGEVSIREMARAPPVPSSPFMLPHLVGQEPAFLLSPDPEGATIGSSSLPSLIPHPADRASQGMGRGTAKR